MEKKQRPNFWPSGLLYGCGLCAVFVFVLVFVVVYWHLLSLAYYGIRTQGTIVGRSPCSTGEEGGLERGWVVTIAYDDRAGGARTFQTFCGQQRLMTPGSRVALRYLPTDPGVADLEDNITSGLGFAATLFACGILILGAVLIGVYQRYVADYVLLLRLRGKPAKRAPTP